MSQRLIGNSCRSQRCRIWERYHFLLSSRQMLVDWLIFIHLPGTSHHRSEQGRKGTRLDDLAAAMLGQSELEL
eukprot:4154098-Amphidinium_carterae.1